MERKWMYYAGLVIVAAIWGTNFAVSKQAMELFDPILFTFLRFGLTIPFFFVLLKMKEGSIGVPIKVALQLALIGLVGVTGLEIATMYSIKYTTLANSSLLNVAPWPIFTAIFGTIFMGERVTARLVTGGIAAMIGVGFVILGGDQGFDLSSNHMFGNLLALGISIVGALFNLACLPLIKRYSTLRVSAWYIMFGALFMLPFTFGSWEKVEWATLSSGGYIAILYNVFFSTLFAFAVWNASMLKVGAARSSFFRYVTPAAAMVAGYFFFGETVSIWQGIGALFMAAGLIWITLDSKREAPITTSASERVG